MDYETKRRGGNRGPTGDNAGVNQRLDDTAADDLRLPRDDKGYGIVTKEFLASAARDELTSTDKIVLIVLATFHNSDTGGCWPSYSTIGRLADKSRTSVWTSITRLADLNYLRVESGQSDGDVNFYTLNTNDYGALVGPFEEEPVQDTKHPPSRNLDTPVQATGQGANEVGVQVTGHPPSKDQDALVQATGHPPSRPRDTNNLIEETKELTKEKAKDKELEMLIDFLPDFQFPSPAECRQYDDILGAIAHCNPTLADDTLAEFSRILMNPAAR